MKVLQKDLQDLTKTGVYKITCLITSKVYVGHTRKSFYNRYKSHYDKLRSNNHKAYHYLQSSANKYGIENFEFSIIEICDTNNHIERESYWINTLMSYDRKFGYNINRYPDKASIFTTETKLKIIAALKDGYKTGRIQLNEGVFKVGTEPWNKGKRYESTDHLKVPKKNKGSRENFKVSTRNKLPTIEVYSSDDVYIGTWNSAVDLYEDSLNDEFKLIEYMKLRNPKGRNGLSAFVLQTVNVNRSCKLNTPYKGLLFKSN